MPSYRLFNLLFRGAIACGSGSIVGWLVFADFGAGLQIGAIATFVSYLSALAAAIQRRRYERQLRHSLRRQVDTLLEKRHYLQQAIAVTATSQQELAASVGALQNERTQLLAGVSELYNRRRQLTQELTQLEATNGDRSSGSSTPSPHERELHQIAFSKTIQIQQLEVRLAELRAEYEQLKGQVKSIGKSSPSHSPDPAPTEPERSSPRRSRAKARRKVDAISDFAQKKQLAERAPAPDVPLQLSQLTIPDLQPSDLGGLPQEWRDFANVLNAEERAAIARSSTMTKPRSSNWPTYKRRCRKSWWRR
ncbi:MAG: hypothetical protein HC838_13320 [Spirulinaceae cyanobacterium RM2_2_10]|nr:hypothetical protein [Spirulinaceae cyanobacterium RM2_2_10]